MFIFVDCRSILICVSCDLFSCVSHFYTFGAISHVFHVDYQKQLSFFLFSILFWWPQSVVFCLRPILSFFSFLTFVLFAFRSATDDLLWACYALLLYFFLSNFFLSLCTLIVNKTVFIYLRKEENKKWNEHKIYDPFMLR